MNGRSEQAEGEPHASELAAVKLELARAELELTRLQLAKERAPVSGFRALLSPTGVVLVGAALGLIGTALGKHFDQQITSRQQQTSVILKASEVPASLPEEEQAKQRARNLLWFEKADYIDLPDAFRKELLETAELDDDQALPAPIIQASPAPAAAGGPEPHYNFPVANRQPVDPAGWDVDIFSCTSEGPQFDSAARLARSLAEAADAKQRLGGFRLGRIRTDAGRQHARPGNVIFADPPETGFAAALAEAARGQTQRSFAVRPNNERPTQSYLSVYFCGA